MLSSAAPLGGAAFLYFDVQFVLFLRYMLQFHEQFLGMIVN